MEQTSVILQLLKLPPKLQAAGTSFSFSLEKERFNLRQLCVELVEEF